MVKNDFIPLIEQHESLSKQNIGHMLWIDDYLVVELE